MSDESRACSVNFCINPAMHEEVAESTHWRFTVHYCHEHHREIANGTPLGPLGLDASHVEIVSLGTNELRAPAMQPSPAG